MLFAALGFFDYAMIALIVAFSAGSAVVLRPSDQARLKRLERKLDLLLKHFEIKDPGLNVVDDLSEEVRKLADDGQKIEAIKLHREQTGLGLKESKDAVEAYIDRR